MKYSTILSSLLLVPALAAALQAGEIKVSYPRENQPLPLVSRTFIFGTVSPATAPFFINGERVRPHTNGGFIAYLPVNPGEFSFNCELREGATGYATTFLARKVRIGPAAQNGAETPRPALELVSPSSDLELSQGDYLNVHAAGEPGREVSFSLGSVVEDEKMVEIPAGSGRYYGSYRVREGDRGRGLKLTARFGGVLRHSGRSSREVKVDILDKFTLVEISTDSVNLRSAEDGGYVLFLSSGVKLASDGRAGGMRRVWLTPSEHAWVEESKVSAVGRGAAPRTKTGSIRLKAQGAGSSALVTVYEKVPYSVEHEGDTLRLKLYYTRLHTNWVVYDSSDTLVGKVDMRQGAGYAELNFRLARELWGYNVAYGPRGLQVDLKGPPAMSLKWPKPLEGLKVALDPGHSRFYKCRDNARVPMKDFTYDAMPEGCWLDGAVGPMATFEVDVNLALADKLRARLSQLGAAVYMTRSGEENVELTDRPRLAVENGGDVFISLHNNAIADGEDPFGSPRGFSVYHYHPHSFSLARSVHRSFLSGIKLPDEGLRFGDYHVARMTQMPSILIEHAHMIMPEQEELLNTPAFQEKLAGAVAAGLLDFAGAPPQPTAKAAPGKKREKR
ncbi:MAG: N-acetylmuramoyl-L-alanine amidase [Elusimicrobia bacterium]|nr:MAG: N-acetylmuramoyl-L-alanine amidase [Elusimicrobiota bacterium]KAF0157110.1 MAG: N-acetylmuramoyl-L-alanine amidase [Elusimicrobiota bacterium]